ncbi:peptidyl-prolyl cis-trans isomerase slr1251-like [Rhopilema esculentum]|uniref:peptidyl-prolyl cis-trans isomerase slr1251-like n=1 Tax=Rhopilema esculentum TaxID=499914 RepID=UPI0031D35ADA|eukprot:gene17215-8764_t
MAQKEEGNLKKSITVYGLLTSVSFQQAKIAAETIASKRKDVFSSNKSVGMLECDWMQFITTVKRTKQGETWGFKDETLVFIGENPLGSAEYFINWLATEYEYEEFRPLPLFYAMAKEEYKNHLLESGHEFVFLSITVANEPAGKILIELFTDKCPKTCENFKQLCIGEKEEKERHSPPLSLTYKRSIFHRIVPNGWIQGGDFEGGSGTGGESIYGETFEDENFSAKHDKRGMVGMANKGRHSNGSQFYITLQPAPWMDTQYVAFGKVIEGTETLNELEKQETYNERPVKECRISDCGVLDVHSLYQV